jgi:hypothetical protein
VRENQSGQLTSESHVIPPADDEDGQRVIWGTNVSIADSMKKFREFLIGFQKKYRLRADNVEFEEGEGEEYTYAEMLKTVILSRALILDAGNSSFLFEFVDSRFSGVSCLAKSCVPVAFVSCRNCTYDGFCR